MGDLANAPITRPPRTQTEGLQIVDHRLIISCAVVERASHHCGRDLFELREHKKVGRSVGYITQSRLYSSRPSLITIAPWLCHRRVTPVPPDTPQHFLFLFFVSVDL